MTGPATGEPEAGATAPTRTTGTRDAVSAILIVLALGLAFRLILAYTLPGSGFKTDLVAFRFWENDLATNGPWGFYDRPFFHDYTPGYLYVLWALGGIGRVIGFAWSDVLPGLLDLDLKLPAILADLGIAWLVWSMVRELGGGRRAALFGAAIIVANPIFWFDSVVWGQVDSVGVLVLLLAVRELWRDRPERAAILTVAAAVIKPQLGILVPIVAAVAIRRALAPAGGYGAEAAPGEPSGPDAGRTTTGWERRVRGPIRIVTTGLAGLLTAVALSLPFKLSIFALVGQVASAAGGYPYLTVNAFNPWALLELDGDGMARNHTWVCDLLVTSSASQQGCGAPFLFGAVPAVVVGTALLLLAVGAITLVVARRPDRLTILVGVAVMAIAFFVVPTRVHERYLFPVYAVGAILAAVSFRWRIAYVALAAATLANMYVVLTTFYPDNPQISDWLGIGHGLASYWGIAIAAAIHLAGFAWAVTQLRADARERLAAEVEASRALPGPIPDVDVATAPDLVIEAGAPRSSAVVGGAGGVSASSEASAATAATAATPGAVTAPAAAPARPRYVLPIWRERPSFAEVGVTGWLRSRINDRPVRPDRTAALRREGGGRLDRLDLWLLVVLVVAASVLRVWRLDEPFRMHFDEVYHARTATEFLQKWRYGDDHDIYEWTHPHLAKYAMAAGIMAFGDDRVTGTAELGVPIKAAVIEPRWDDSEQPRARAGDRLYAATGSEVRAYDLETRALVATTPLAGASSLAVDRANHRLYVGTDTGNLETIELRALDTARADGTSGFAPEGVELAKVGGPITRIHVSSDGSGLLVAVADREIVMIDPEHGTELGRDPFDAIAGFADAGTAPALVAQTDEVRDPAAAATTLADLLGGDAAAYRAALDRSSPRVILASVEASGDTRKAVDDAIGEGRLPGITVQTVPRVAVAHAGGIALVNPGAASIVQEIDLDGGAQGVALVSVDSPTLYVTNASPDGPRYVLITVGGDSAKDQAVLGQSYPLPGAGSWVGFDEASDQVHILGAPPEGRPADQAATVYVIEPHANAVYADAPLSFRPAAMAADVNEAYPSADRQQILAFDGDGTAATVDAGKHAFAWRLPGVVAGIAMAALLYLLTRILFRRRTVAVVVAVLTLLDGMFFVQSRIAMNDAYVGLFIIASYTLFAAIWTGAWRWRGAFWVAMPAIGLLLGLALASKWVAAYAIGALGILILARSALGRVVLLGGMILVTTVLGYMAVSVPGGENGGNLTFLLIMIALTLTAVVVTVLHPIAWSLDELRFAIGAPAVAGAAVALVALAVGRMNTAIVLGPVAFTPLHLAFALAVLALVVAGLFWVAGRAGFGPLAPLPTEDDPVRLLEPPAPPAEGWLRPGWALGLPLAWMVVCLLAIPLAVYVASYLPWAYIDGHQIVTGWPSGHSGQTLLDLTKQMYAYHNNLADAHPASSPWWAWPFDLKPVWFYQESFAGGTSAAIYDAGNLTIWWLGVPAMAFCAWQAFRRRSLPLALVTVAFACQWVAWARIDRAAFQYHYYTSLPFVVIALGYFIAELWHGASRRTWLVARVAAAAAIVAPAALWLFHRPLCGFVRVESVNPGSQACPTVIPEFVLTQRTAALAIVIGIAVFFLVREFVRLDRPASEGPAGRSRADSLVPLIAAALGAIVALGVTTALFGEVDLLRLTNVPVEPVAIVVALPLLGLAAIVVTARDARRFVLGLLGVIAATFVVFYPNISALPLPSAVFNAYQGFLPTYLYPFQFPVSTVSRSGAGPVLFALGPAVLLGALTVTGLVLAYSAWVWRLALAERAADEGADGGRDPAWAGGRGG